MKNGRQFVKLTLVKFIEVQFIDINTLLWSAMKYLIVIRHIVCFLFVSQENRS